MILPDGSWSPTLTPRGVDVFNDMHRFLLVDGPRRSGKTLSILHKLCRHAWENPKACIAIVCKTLKNAEIGVWKDLFSTVAAEWEKSGIGFKISQPVRQNAASKLPYFRIRSCDGQESEFQLHSCERPEEAEEKFKGGRFSAIYISEADQIVSPKDPTKDRDLFNILAQQLRSLDVPHEAQQLICDCNPPKTALRHWIAKVFFPHTEGDGPRVDPVYSALFGRVSVPLESNTLLDPRERAELIAQFSYDPDLFARMVEGKWLEDIRDTHFADVFGDSSIVGDVTDVERSKWSIIKPPDYAITFFTGWDLGDVNHAVCFFFGWPTDFNTMSYANFDEVVSVERKIPIHAIAKRVEDKLKFWGDFFQERFGRPIHWRHWSDTSAFNRYRAAANTYDAVLVRQATDHRILLQPVEKGPGSVRQRLLLARRLLGERKVWQSAYCHNTNEMLRKLRRGSDDDPVGSDDPHRHVWDAWSYALTMECPIQRSSRAPSAERGGIVVARSGVVR